MIPKLPKGLTRPMRIGKGTFASVYRVRQTTLDRWVAVKIIDERDPQKRETILKEGKTQAKLAMRHIPQIYDAFEWKKKVYIVMQWVPGVALSTVLQQDPDVKDRIVLANALIHILAELHELGYAHRDLKPDNIIISPNEGMYFVDFSFAKNVKDGRVSMEGKVKGTPAFMAPELWHGNRDVDYIRADLYAIGLILKEILRGETWQSLIASLTDVNPAHRPESGGELLTTWSNLLRKEGQSGDVEDKPDWIRLAHDLSCATMAENLMVSARELLALHRYDEAYWLLVESLENNPDNPETLALISTVDQQPKKHRHHVAVVYSIIACIVVLLLIVFFTGRETGKSVTTRTVVEDIGQKEHIILGKSVPKQRTIRTERLPLLTGSMEQSALTGTIYLVGYPEKGQLVVDNERTYTHDAVAQGIILPGNRYTFAWKDTNNQILWREKITMLPFQKKVINMPVH